MLEQVLAWNPGQQPDLLRLRHALQQAVVPKPVEVQVDAERAEEALSVHQSDRDPHCRGYQGSLRDGAKHVAEDGRILAPLPCGSVPLLRQHRDIIVQDETQHEEPYRRDDEQPDPVAVVVLWHTGAAELEGRVHLRAGQCHDAAYPIHEGLLVGLEELEHHTKLIHLGWMRWTFS